jgi:proline dehydrogenase
VAAIDVETEIQRVGRALADAFPSKRGNPLKAIDDRAMDLAAQDAELRAALFRFVDVVPACRSLDDLAGHLTGLLEQVDTPPPPLRAAVRMGDTRAGRTALGAAGAAGVRHMAHRFIVGEDPAAAVPILDKLWRDGIAASVDLLGEATVSAAEADRYAARCAEALETLGAAYGCMDEQPLLEADAFGPLPRANLSVKVSALTPLLRPEAPERGQRDAAPRLRELLRRAEGVGAHLHIDMESLDSRESILELVLEILSEPEFAAGPSAGIVLQAYLRDSPQTLDAIVDWSRASERRLPLVVRLVKGAYWDHEVVEARQHGWSVPVFERKADCDLNFEELTTWLLEARPLVRVAIASHNLRSVSHAVARNRLLGSRDDDVEFQILRGLGDDLGHALAANGLRVRAYCPVGDLVAGMAYLVRRLLENTANESFLHEQASGVPLAQLLAAPGTEAR